MGTVSAPRKPYKTGIRRPGSGVDITPGRLAELRISKLLTRQELAERAGLTMVSVAKLETGERRPSVKTLRQLCEALDCQPGDLLKPS